MISSPSAGVEPEVLLEPLRLQEGGPRVVALGGGHGLAQVLEAVQGYAGEITAVVTVSDDGGSSGRLSGELGIPPPGDIRRCLLALSPEPSVWGEVFGYRFDRGDVAGHSMGNLVLATLSEMLGGFDAAVRASETMLGAVGRVVPVADRWLRMRARVGGRVVEGQAAITKARGGIEELSLVPSDVTASPAALEAIGAADQVILGPGSLFTSLLSVLIVPGIAPAISRSNAQRVFILNLLTQDGETIGLTGIDHLNALIKVGELEGPGAIVAHRGGLLAEPGLEPLHIEPAEAEALGWEVAEAEITDPQARWPQHDPIRLGELLRTLARRREAPNERHPGREPVDPDRRRRRCDRSTASWCGPTSTFRSRTAR